MSMKVVTVHIYLTPEQVKELAVDSAKDDMSVTQKIDCVISTYLEDHVSSFDSSNVVTRIKDL